MILIYPKQVQIVPLHIDLTKKLTSGVDIMWNIFTWKSVKVKHYFPHSIIKV